MGSKDNKSKDKTRQETKARNADPTIQFKH